MDSKTPIQAAQDAQQALLSESPRKCPYLTLPDVDEQRLKPIVESKGYGLEDDYKISGGEDPSEFPRAGKSVLSTGKKRKAGEAADDTSVASKHRKASEAKKTKLIVNEPPEKPAVKKKRKTDLAIEPTKVAKKNKKRIDVVTEEHVETEQEPVDAKAAAVIEPISKNCNEQRQTE